MGYSSSSNLNISQVKHVGMEILNLIEKENYFAQITLDFRELINKKIERCDTIFENLNISRSTLFRIRRNESYWCNLSTLFDLVDSLKISDTELLNNIIQIKTKNSFPARLQDISINSSLMKVIAHILGDGGITVDKKGGKYRAFYTNTEMILINSFKEDIHKIFGELNVYSRIRAGRASEVWLPTTVGSMFYNIMNYELLNQRKRVPEFVFRIKDNGLLGSFLQALYDDEGFIYPQKRMICIAQKSELLIQDIQKVVSLIGIRSNHILIHRSKNRTTMYYFTITGKENILKFNDLIGFMHPIKKKKLKILVNKYI